MAADHVWKFPAIAAGSNALHMYASISGDPGYDYFNLAYSTDGVTYTNFGSVSKNTMELYQFSLPITGAYANVYIKATNANPINTVNSTLSVGRMCVYNVVSSSDTIVAVTSVKAYDMNDDGYQDIIISDNRRVWVLLNDGVTGTYTTNIKMIPLPVSTIIAVVPGIFVHGDTLPDLAVATLSGIYIISHTGPTTYATPVLALPGVIINNPLDSCIQSGDVDGDGDDDLLVGMGGKIALYINGGGVFRIFTIETISGTVKTLCLGKTTG